VTDDLTHPMSPSVTLEEQLRLGPHLRLRFASRAQRAARALGRFAASLARDVLHAPARAWLRASLPGNHAGPAPRQVKFGSFRRLIPISRHFGKDRGGAPIDRYYIERFLAAHASDIGGHVLEVQDAIYTLQFGGDRVTQSDVLHVVPGNPDATIVADLVCAPHIPSESFDCIILTQVLPFIQDVPSAIRTVHRMLRPGGVVLATVPGISQIIRHDMDRWGDYWRFTTLSARRLFESVFPPAHIEVEAHGNVLVAVAFLHGLASNELQGDELAHVDPDYEVLITIRAVKSGPGRPLDQRSES
jgi:hypothetical protein